MEDENKILYFLGKFKVVLIILAVVIIGVVGFFVYKNIMINKTTSDFNSYLLETGYKKNPDGTYTKSATSDTQNINYMFVKESSVLSKDITESVEGGTLNISLNYTNSGEISVSLQYDGLNKNNIYGTLLQTADYNSKTSGFTCKILAGNGYTTRCDEMKKEAQAFDKEMKDFLSKGNIKAKYVS